MIFPLTFFYIFTLLFLFTELSVAVDTISLNQKLRDNGQTLVSSGEAFELGFFSPPNSNNRYIGIWFKNVPIQTPIWVANKNNPLPDSSGVLTITATGNIVITTTNNNHTTTVWSSPSSPTTAANNPVVLQLLDIGNLVVKSGSDNYLWQSFDYPCDTLVPGMKHGWNLRTNQEWYLTSWKSLQDPSSGDYTYRLDPCGLPQTFLRQGLRVKYRGGPWDGVRFGGDLPLQRNTVFNPIFIFNSNYVYYSFENIEDTTISRFVVNHTGLLKHLTWNEKHGEWIEITTLQGDACDHYATCGPYGICFTSGSPICHCPDGFIPKSQQDWNGFEWSGGCVPRTPLNCSAPEGFKKFSRLKLPDTPVFMVNRTEMSHFDCEAACLRNCSCVAYSQTQVSGCVVWFGELLDIKESNTGGQDLYIRMAASELGLNKNNRTTMIAIVTVISGILLLGLISWYLMGIHIIHKRRGLQRNIPFNDDENINLQIFDIVTIAKASNNFSISNKIGEGGFGPVYKGQLSTGEEIAIKRLSKNSKQGFHEFKNEVILIAKLQHRNLVRLLGCCIQGEERMLIYEYLPNGSLSSFIFDNTRSNSLTWRKRFDVIVGIARGLLYLHRDSRLRIIHRDLKASNVLLDNEMNPKISDFGIARAFRGDKKLEKTRRVIGTYGYMSPEYIMHGIFSMKSDVFSFGVLVLEIVSGRRNKMFQHPNHTLNLLGYAWKLWIEGKAVELTDEKLETSKTMSEVIKCIQIGLLCVQKRPEDRPMMSSVVSILDNESATLPQPKQPGFYTERGSDEAELALTVGTQCATNEMTLSLLFGR